MERVEEVGGVEGLGEEAEGGVSPKMPCRRGTVPMNQLSEM